MRKKKSADQPTAYCQRRLLYMLAYATAQQGKKARSLGCTYPRECSQKSYSELETTFDEAVRSTAVPAWVVSQATKSSMDDVVSRSRSRANLNEPKKEKFENLAVYYVQDPVFWCALEHGF